MDRLARRALVLLAVLMLLPSAAALIADLLLDAVREFGAGVGDARSGASSLGSVIFILFLVGVLVRLSRHVGRLDPFTGRLREVNERRARLAARYPAEDVPVHEERRDPDDPDPALDWEDLR